ncbi:MAG: serine/threonine-protein kinase [Sandaracinaceae bacterium]
MNVGDSLAGYEVVAKIKAGGMASLYLGRQAGAAGFRKHVAIKVVHEHLAEDESFVRMFLDEARISARIEHPNVVHVHGMGEQDGEYFLVMEYVPGCALSTLLRELSKANVRLSPVVASWIAIQVARGLQAAHDLVDDEGQSLGVVHRDVSPKNILIAYKGYVKLIDFGIAKAADSGNQTSAGVMKGTIRYMSPEQAFGRPVDHRTDIYALGIVLWELLTGHQFYVGDTNVELLAQARRPDVVPPGAFVDLPAALDEVVLRALAPDPADRFASVGDLGRAIGRAVPEALHFEPRHLGELVSVLVPEQSPRQSVSDISLISALGRPLAVNDPERVMSSLTESSVDRPAVPGLEGATLVTPSVPHVSTAVLAQVDAAVRTGILETTEEPPPSRGSPTMIIVAGLVVGLLAAAVGVLGAVLALKGGDDPPAVLPPPPTPSARPMAASPQPPPELPTPPTSPDIAVPPVVIEPPSDPDPEDPPSTAPATAGRRRRRGAGPSDPGATTDPPETGPAETDPPPTQRRGRRRQDQGPVIFDDF